MARVLPADPYERLLFHGVTADVWMQDGVTEQNLRQNMAGFYRQADPDGALALVLGAGNVSAIVPLDIADRMINCGQVVICKMNPVNDYLGPIFEDIFAPLVRDGYLAFVYGGGDLGEYLTHHDAVQAIHITGSAQTHDLIVYGPGQEGQRRKAADDRVLDKPVTSELGGVGATIVLPGPWTEADFRYQAEHVVTQKLHNSGHNCVASQVLILPAGWDGHDTMLAHVRRQLDQAEDRTAYYPGTEQRLAALQHAAPDAETLGGGTRRLLVANVDPAQDHYGFRTEFFAPAMVTTSLPGDARQFLRGPSTSATTGSTARCRSTSSSTRRPARSSAPASTAHRRPALRRDRDQRLGRRRLPAPPRRLGRLPRAHLHRRAIRHRRRAQRADVRQAAQDRRVRAVPALPSVGPARRAHPVPQAALVPHQQDIPVHRPETHPIRRRPVPGQTARHLRLSPQRLTHPTPPGGEAGARWPHRRAGGLATPDGKRAHTSPA